MAPKQRNRSDPNATVNHHSDNTDKHSDQELQLWDGQPYLKPTWYVRNKRTLYKEIPEARQFIESGVIVGLKSVTVFSLPHLQSYLGGDFTKGTLDAPFDFSTLPEKCTPIEVSVEAEDTASLFPSPPPSEIEIIPTTLAELAKHLDFDTKRFTIAPEMIVQFNERIARHWINRITCDHLQRETLDDCNNSGTAFIRAMEKEMSSTDQDKNSASTLRLAHSERRGRERAPSSTRAVLFGRWGGPSAHTPPCEVHERARA